MLKQSAAKPLSVINTYEESSQTIAKCEYNFTNELEKGSTLSQMSEGEDIVETKNKTFFEKSVELHKKQSTEIFSTDISNNVLSYFS